MIDEDTVKDLKKKFRLISENPEEIEEQKLVMTFDSLKKGIKQIFGHTNSFFTQMFYYLFTGGYDRVDVRFADFLEQIYPYYDFDQILMMKSTYRLMDSTNDNELTITDLLHIQACMPKGS